MKTLATLFVLAAVLVGGRSGLAADEHSLAAISGYDPVAYFTVNQAVRGSGFHVSEFQGQKFLFASKENKELFEANPEKYVPAFGGWCAYGVAVNKKFHSDPTVFAIVDGTLYLNLDRDIQKTWDKDRTRNIKKAKRNWKKIQDKRMASL